MKMILSERNLVVVLFILVFITFAMAHEDSKKMEKGYAGFNTSAAQNIATLHYQDSPIPSMHDLHSANISE